MSTIIENIERKQLRRVPRFSPGDRVRVHFQVVEGTRKRTQVFEGIVIARQGSGARETFAVRKQSFGVGVERIFPVHSPKIERLEVVARGDVRRAKLYYLRGRVGKRARVAERRWGIEDDLIVAEEPKPPEDVEMEEPPADAEPVEYEAPASEPIAEGAAVVPADSEGAEEATEQELAAAEADSEAEGVASEEGDPEPDGAESADDAEAAEAAGDADSEKS
jgi:large subunit ribosomal protein L19